jgi:hypothetical protein
VGALGTHREPMRKPQPYPIEQAGEVVTPRDSYHDVAQRVLHNERPANNLGRQLAKRGIGVCRAADRNDSRKLRVAQGQKRAGHGHKHEQQRYGRPTSHTSFPNGAGNTCSNNSHNPYPR